MPYLVDDHLDTLEMVEENGVVKSLTRQGTISGLITNDYLVLLEAYQQVGLPNPGTFLVNNADPLNVSQPPTPPGKAAAHAMLLLAKRTFKLRNNDKKTVDVILRYEHFMEGDNQVLTPQAMAPQGWKVPYSTTVYGKNRASVSQSKTNFYNTRTKYDVWNSRGNYPVGSIVDYRGLYWRAVQQQIWAGGADLIPPPGPTGTLVGVIWEVVDDVNLPPGYPAPGIRRQIAVAHQYPGVGPGRDRDHPGQTLYQTGEITYMQPNDNFKLHGQVFIRNPRVIKKAVLGAINLMPWMDGKSYTWMCTEVSWEPMYVSWQWRMSFEFQHNEDTWLPTAIFHDQRLGRAPANLLSGMGYRTIHRHPELDFERYFNVTFGCAPAAGA